jgi:hypothetical protein
LFGTRPDDEPDVYLRLPPGLNLIADYMRSMGMDVDPLLNYYDANGRPMAWKLNGNLYGTITAGRTFFLFVRAWLVDELGFTQSTPDPCVFILRTEMGFIIDCGDQGVLPHRLPEEVHPITRLR